MIAELTSPPRRTPRTRRKIPFWTGLNLLSSVSPVWRGNLEPRSEVRAASRLLNHSVCVEAAAFGNQFLEERRRLPVIAEPRAVFLYALQHRVEADCVRVEHRAAAMTREAEAVGVDDVDVARARGVPFLEHARAFVGERRRDARDDLLVGDRPPPDAARRRRLIGELFDQRIGGSVAAAGRVVLVPAGAGLLAVAAHLEELIGDVRLRSFRAGLADRFQVLPDARADVDAGDVLHAVRTDGQAELRQ